MFTKEQVTLLPLIKNACNDILEVDIDHLEQYSFWTCRRIYNHVRDNTSSHIPNYIIDRTIEDIASEFVYQQLNFRPNTSAFINEWVGMNKYSYDTTLRSNMKYWRIIWMNFIINKCDQYIRGDFKLLD